MFGKLFIERMFLFIGGKMNWWLIAIIVVGGLLLLRFKEVRHRFGLMVTLILIIFFVASVGQLYATHNLDLSSFDGIVSAGKVYFSWLGNALGNTLKVTSYVVKQDWSVNSTNFTGR